MAAIQRTRAEADRAADLVLALVEYHTGRPATDALTRLVQDNGLIARSEVLRHMGHIPANPRAWVRQQADRHRYDGGRGCPGFSVA